MLTVATSDAFVGPTRLLFPKVPGGMGEAASFPYSLLGLGDIAVPGELFENLRAVCVSLPVDSGVHVVMNKARIDKRCDQCIASLFWV